MEGIAPKVAPKRKLFPPNSPKNESPFSLSGKTGDQINRAHGKNCSLTRPPRDVLQCWEREEGELDSDSEDEEGLHSFEDEAAKDPKVKTKMKR